MVIVDFVRQNLLHAFNLLGELINNQIALLNGNATQLTFPDDTFDLVWSVQTFQHIPDFESAVRESHRIFTGKEGVFINYSLNIARLNKFIYKIARRNYHIIDNSDTFYLAKASSKQMQVIKSIFNAKVTSRYTKILFHPDLKLSFTGRENSFLGKVDAYLGGSKLLLGYIARQQSFEVKKP